ncbi:unnamed protein product [Psylliodes chrysocephalus]|uniref:Uncharacterized protein n=1 Tax=Psylliodes chrysocephalus TaxID=3402493 RepID=A0A9P0GHE2_9CUCU|nr:unnamed protein product [Psylliodes chrysocephala]
MRFNIDVSIKNIERLRRGCGDTFLIKGPKTKIPRDWKKFLGNGKNKEQLVNLLHNEWKQDKYAHHFHGKKLYLSHNDQCTLFTSEDGSTVYYTVQEEADTNIILHCFHASQFCQDKLPIRIRSSNTDVFMLLLRYVNEIENVLLFDTGVGNKRRVSNVTNISDNLGVAKWHAMLNMHALSGSDTTSSFVRRGKLSVKSKLEKCSKFVPILRSLGSSFTVTYKLVTYLEEFVCYLYSNKGYIDINKLRYELFTHKYSPTVTSTLPNTQGDPLPSELTDVMESYHPDEFEDENESDLVNFTCRCLEIFAFIYACIIKILC